MTTKIISVGGSMIAPDKPDTDFVMNFVEMAKSWLSEDDSRRLILVAGGGAPARVYQNAYSLICGDNANVNAADWIGVKATRLNAELLRACFGDLCKDKVVHNPIGHEEFTGRVLMAAGWKPGFSSDNVAVLLAENYGAKEVINLSNVEKVYTDDPKKNPDAKPIDNISWKDFRLLVGDKWIPGKNTPFDPIASKKAEELNLTVICTAGKDLENIKAILDGKEFVGTRIGN